MGHKEEHQNMDATQRQTRASNRAGECTWGSCNPLRFQGFSRKLNFIPLNTYKNISNNENCYVFRECLQLKVKRIRRLLESVRIFKTQKDAEGIDFESVRSKYEDIATILHENYPRDDEEEFPRTAKLPVVK